MNSTRVLSIIISLLVFAGCSRQQEDVPQDAKQPLVGRSADHGRCDGENRVLELLYPLSIDEMRDILFREDPLDPFHTRETAQPIDLLEKAGVPMKDVETQYADGAGKIIIIAPQKAHKIIRAFLKVEPYSNDPL